MIDVTILPDGYINLKALFGCMIFDNCVGPVMVQLFRNRYVPNISAFVCLWFMFTLLLLSFNAIISVDVLINLWSEFIVPCFSYYHYRFFPEVNEMKREMEQQVIWLFFSRLCEESISFW